jgi:hypothetical protein
MTPGAIRGPISGSGKPFGIGKHRDQVIYQITLPIDLRNLVRAEVEPGGSITATFRQLLVEALIARGAIADPNKPTKETGSRGTKAKRAPKAPVAK